MNNQSDVSQPNSGKALDTAKRNRKKSDAIKEFVSFLLKQDEAFIRYAYEQAKLAVNHWKK